MLAGGIFEARFRANGEGNQAIRRPRKIDYEHAATMRRYDLYSSVFSRLIPWSGVGVVLFFAWKIAGVLAGKTTTSQIVFALLTDIKTSSGLAKAITATFGASGVGYGYRQRKLRQRDIQSRSDYIRQLEEKIDPNRTSSRLTPRGTTPREN